MAISVGGFIGDKIIALAIGEVRTRAQVQPEDHGLLPSTYYENDNFRLGYILSLGVSQQYRCRGLASKLLAQQLQLFQEFNCSCVYLHVLSSNSAARIFYEKRNFTVHLEMPYYYSINGVPATGIVMSCSSTAPSGLLL